MYQRLALCGWECLSVCPFICPSVCLSVCLSDSPAYTGGPLESDEAAAAMQGWILKVHASQLQKVASGDHQILCGKLVVGDLACV